MHPASSRITPTKTVGPDFPGARTPVGTLVRFSTRKAAFTGRVMELREETARVGTGTGGRWRVPYERLQIIRAGPGQKRTLREADTLIQSLMRQHQQTGRLHHEWRAAFDLAAVRAGVCKYGEQLICLPRQLRDDGGPPGTDRYRPPRDRPRDGRRRPQPRPHLEAAAQRIGCTAQRCTHVIHTAPRWIGTCNCKRPLYRTRLTRLARTGRCTKCLTPYKWRREHDRRRRRPAVSRPKDGFDAPNPRLESTPCEPSKNSCTKS